jgi:dTDP-4-amino-4,6-dideoxygalactose transaminase
MSNYQFPLFKVHVPNDEALQNIKSVFESGFINEGIEVTRLTKALQRQLCAPHLLLTNSCTNAITLALHLIGVGPGDDVVTTPMTCVATNTPIVTRGANISWTDVDPLNGMPTPEMIERAITPATKAVIVVAWAGTPPDLIGINKVCDDHNIPLILDAAHAFDAKFAGKHIHEYADYTAYSFQAIKHFTTGDGGALICCGKYKFDRAKALKWFGLDRDAAKDAKGNWKGQQWDADIVEAGYKFNMNNVAAAIGLSQLAYIDSILLKHRENAATYDKEFLRNPIRGIRPVTRHHDALSSHWVYTMTIDTTKTKMTRDKLLVKLNEQGIMAGVVHVPNDTYTTFKAYKKDLPGVRQFGKTQFSLPCGWWMHKRDVRRIVEVVSNVMSESSS